MGRRESSINDEPEVDICRGESSRERQSAGRTAGNRGRVGNYVKRGKFTIFQGARGRAGRHLPVVYEIFRRG